MLDWEFERLNMQGIVWKKIDKISASFVLVIDQDFFFYKKIMIASCFLITLTVTRKLYVKGDFCWRKKTF
ncbi:hypothetical protein J2Y73_003716 [Peribacillus frigoritolerans]|nr:hypothetical protein [Peribacillus frigoritolerans]